MKALALIGGGLIAITLIALIIGWSLPVAHEASRSATFNTSPDALFGLISDVASYPRWWSEISQIEMLPADGGRIRFREHMSSGPIVMEVVERVPPTRFVTRIADPDQPFGGTWTFEITPATSGTRLTITERGEIYNPLFRFMSRFVFGYTGTIESFLNALASKVGGVAMRIKEPEQWRVGL
jgi:uncharacterized protein YndB with AHSA1/START domain